MASTANKPATATQKSIQSEARQIRAAAESVAASKTAANRFLASTGMHQSNGPVKPKFR